MQLLVRGYCYINVRKDYIKAVESGGGRGHGIGALSVTRQTFSVACNAAFCTNETGDPESNKASTCAAPSFPVMYFTFNGCYCNVHGHMCSYDKRISISTVLQ